MSRIRNLLGIAALLLAFALTTYAQWALATLRHSSVLQLHSFSGAAPPAIASPDFTFTAGTTPRIFPGAESMSTLSVAAVSGFTGTISFTCSSFSPATSQGIACSPIVPVTITATAASAVTKLNITTTAASAHDDRDPVVPNRITPVRGLSLVGGAALLSALFGFFPHRRWRRPLRLGMVLAVAAASNGCGGGNVSGAINSGTVPGVYTVPVTATSGSLSHTVTVSVTVNFDSF